MNTRQSNNKSFNELPFFSHALECAFSDSSDCLDEPSISGEWLNGQPDVFSKLKDEGISIF